MHFIVAVEIHAVMAVSEYERFEVTQLEISLVYFLLRLC